MNTPPADPRTLVLFGIPFHDVDMRETLARIENLIARRRPSYLVTANLDFAAQASEDVELQRIMVEAELVLCDGTPLVWASKLAGQPLRERVAGSDLVPQLAARAEAKGYKIFLLGGQPEVLERAAQNLMAKHPKLPPVQFFSPPFAALHELDNPTIMQRLQVAKPDILLVAFGCPKQEKWILMHYRKLGIPCCIGVGATVDFLAGKVSRAPGWIGKLGLEWVYRMVQEPGRLAGRYWNDIKFLARQIIRERRASRSSGVLVPAPPGERLPDGIERVNWSGPLHGEALAQLPRPTMKSAFVVDLSGVTSIAPDGLGLMARIIRQAWQAELGACFFSPSPAVRESLEAAKLVRLLPLAATVGEAARRVQAEAAAVRLRPPATENGCVLLFTLPPRVTAENADLCARAVEEGWNARPRMRQLVLDLADTTFIDSSGLGFLLRMHRLAASRAEGGLRLLNLHDNVLNVIKIARVGGLLLGR